MESNEYWRNRALKLEARANEKSEALQKKLKREYTKAAKEIRQKVDSFYLRYANEQGLSYSEAVKALSSKEAREWRKTIGEYVEEIKALPDGALKSRLIAELDMRSYASQQDRLSELASQIDMEIDRLFIGAEQQMSATMTDILEDGYYRKSFDLQQRTGVLTQIPRLSPEFVENALTYPWSGADFSTRLWNNKRALLFSMRQTLTQGAIQGQSIAKMSKSLADTMGKSYIVAERLIRTEANHFHSEADRGAYEAAGVEQYEFMATLDNRVSEVCAGLDGKIFDVKDAQTGVNYPPMHPWCRSTTVEHDPEAAADGEPMPDDMDFEDWEEWQENTLTNAPKNGIEKLKGKINGIKKRAADNGGATEVDIKEAGKIMRAEIEKNQKFAARAAAVTENLKQAEIFAKRCNDLNAKMTKALGNEFDELHKEWDETYSKYKKAIEEYRKALEVRYYENANDIKAIYSDVRIMGSDGFDIAAHLNKSKSKVRKNIEDAYNVYPRDWVEASIKRGKLTPKIEKRGYYSDHKSVIAVSGDSEAKAFNVAIHELGHRFEKAVPNILTHEKDFYARRTDGEALVWLGKGYKGNEKTRRDQFLNPYMGKDYAGTAYELVSMGFEMAYTRPEELLQDEDMAEWIFGLLAIE